MGDGSGGGGGLGLEGAPWVLSGNPKCCRATKRGRGVRGRGAELVARMRQEAKGQGRG